ncbi:neuropeptide Y receptor type 2-like [Hetaerina americana]|uniref:neuropeptide Y receptor type 2-like n=1 Tax=Hetaerina americana TaxID=62018 RepID=UPI003A7F49A0
MLTVPPTFIEDSLELELEEEEEEAALASGDGRARELRLWWGAGEAALLFNFSVNEAYAVVREAQAARSRVLPPAAEAALIAVYSALIVSGLVSNALLCAVAARRWRRWRHRMAPAPRDLLVVNLAVADLSLCAVCMPFTLAALLRGRWTLGEALCKAVPAVQGFNILVSAGTIAAIAIDRYCTIVRATLCMTVHCFGMNWAMDARTRVMASVALIWLLALGAALPVAWYQEVEKVAVGGVVVFEACVERWPSRGARVGYSLGVATFQFAIPAIVLAGVHARISARLLRQSAPTGLAPGRRKNIRRRHRRTTLILSAIAAVFAASWLPMTVFSLLSSVFSSPSYSPPHRLYAVFAACHVAAMSSACTNPVLYGWLNTNFRREFAEIMPGVCAGRMKRSAAAAAATTDASEAVSGRRDARRTSSTLVTALSGRPVTVSYLPSISQVGKSELL